MDEIGLDSLELMDHFRIFDDLFTSGVYFHNTQNIKIKFEAENSNSNVYFGNSIKANITLNAPTVEIEKIVGGFNTLVMVNMDGYGFFTEDNLLTDLSLSDKSDHETNGIYIFVL